MLARIQSFIRGYSPLRSRPEDGARAPGPHVPDGARADAVRGTREALAHWTGVIEHRIENDPILHRIDVAEHRSVAFEIAVVLDRLHVEGGRQMFQSHALVPIEAGRAGAARGEMG